MTSELDLYCFLRPSVPILSVNTSRIKKKARAVYSSNYRPSKSHIDDILSVIFHGAVFIFIFRRIISPFLIS